MKYLLHSSIYALPLQSRPSRIALERWQAVGLEETAVSIMTEAVVLTGLYLHRNEQRFLYYQNTIRGRVRVIGVDEPVARLFARLKARQEEEVGEEQRLPDSELFVAATAKVHGLTVALLNQDSRFPASEDVAWEDWGAASTN